MPVPIYRIAKDFLRIEALGTQGSRSSDPADPIELNCRVTESGDTSKIIEEGFSTKTEDKERVLRLQTGRWAFQLNPGLYESRKQYTLNFRYYMTPGNLSVDRANFTWDPVPLKPSLPENCVIFGTLVDLSGVPVVGERLVVERYRDMATLNEREAENVVTTNSFGLWAIELPRKALVRFVFGNLSKVVKVPDVDSAALSSVPEHQPAQGRVDKFGYPFPGAR